MVSILKKPKNTSAGGASLSDSAAKCLNNQILALRIRSYESFNVTPRLKAPCLEVSSDVWRLFMSSHEYSYTPPPCTACFSDAPPNYGDINKDDQPPSSASSPPPVLGNSINWKAAQIWNLSEAIRAVEADSKDVNGGGNLSNSEPSRHRLPTSRNKPRDDMAVVAVPQESTANASEEHVNHSLSTSGRPTTSSSGSSGTGSGGSLILALPALEKVTKTDHKCSQNGFCNLGLVPRRVLIALSLKEGDLVGARFVPSLLPNCTFMQITGSCQVASQLYSKPKGIQAIKEVLRNVPVIMDGMRIPVALPGDQQHAAWLASTSAVFTRPRSVSSAPTRSGSCGGTDFQSTGNAGVSEENLQALESSVSGPTGSMSGTDEFSQRTCWLQIKNVSPASMALIPRHCRICTRLPKEGVYVAVGMSRDSSATDFDGGDDEETSLSNTESTDLSSNDTAERKQDVEKLEKEEVWIELSVARDTKFSVARQQILDLTTMWQRTVLGQTPEFCEGEDEENGNDDDNSNDPPPYLITPASPPSPLPPEASQQSTLALFSLGAAAAISQSMPTVLGGEPTSAALAEDSSVCGEGGAAGTSSRGSVKSRHRVSGVAADGAAASGEVQSIAATAAAVSVLEDGATSALRANVGEGGPECLADGTESSVPSQTFAGASPEARRLSPASSLASVLGVGGGDSPASIARQFCNRRASPVGSVRSIAGQSGVSELFSHLFPDPRWPQNVSLPCDALGFLHSSPACSSASLPAASGGSPGFLADAYMGPVTGDSCMKGPSVISCAARKESGSSRGLRSCTRSDDSVTKVVDKRTAISASPSFLTSALCRPLKSETPSDRTRNSSESLTTSRTRADYTSPNSSLPKPKLRNSRESGTESSTQQDSPSPSTSCAATAPVDSHSSNPDQLCHANLSSASGREGPMRDDPHVGDLKCPEVSTTAATSRPASVIDASRGVTDEASSEPLPDAGSGGSCADEQVALLQLLCVNIPRGLFAVDKTTAVRSCESKSVAEGGRTAVAPSRTLTTLHGPAALHTQSSDSGEDADGQHSWWRKLLASIRAAGTEDLDYGVANGSVASEPCNGTIPRNKAPCTLLSSPSPASRKHCEAQPTGTASKIFGGQPRSQGAGGSASDAKACDLKGGDRLADRPLKDATSANCSGPRGAKVSKLPPAEVVKDLLGPDSPWGLRCPSCLLWHGNCACDCSHAVDRSFVLPLLDAKIPKDWEAVSARKFLRREMSKRCEAANLEGPPAPRTTSNDSPAGSAAIVTRGWDKRRGMHAPGNCRNFQGPIFAVGDVRTVRFVDALRTFARRADPDNVERSGGTRADGGCCELEAGKVLGCQKGTEDYKVLPLCGSYCVPSRAVVRVLPPARQGRTAGPGPQGAERTPAGRRLREMDENAAALPQEISCCTNPGSPSGHSAFHAQRTRTVSGEVGDCFVELGHRAVHAAVEVLRSLPFCEAVKAQQQTNGFVESDSTSGSSLRPDVQVDKPQAAKSAVSDALEAAEFTRTVSGQRRIGCWRLNDECPCRACQLAAALKSTQSDDDSSADGVDNSAATREEQADGDRKRESAFTASRKKQGPPPSLAHLCQMPAKRVHFQTPIHIAFFEREPGEIFRCGERAIRCKNATTLANLRRGAAMAESSGDSYFTNGNGGQGRSDKQSRSGGNADPTAGGRGIESTKHKDVLQVEKTRRPDAVTAWVVLCLVKPSEFTDAGGLTKVEKEGLSLAFLVRPEDVPLIRGCWAGADGVAGGKMGSAPTSASQGANRGSAVQHVKSDHTLFHILERSVCRPVNHTFTTTEWRLLGAEPPKSAPEPSTPVLSRANSKDSHCSSRARTQSNSWTCNGNPRVVRDFSYLPEVVENFIFRVTDERVSDAIQEYYNGGTNNIGTEHASRQGSGDLPSVESTELEGGEEAGERHTVAVERTFSGLSEEGVASGAEISTSGDPAISPRSSSNVGADEAASSRSACERRGGRHSSRRGIFAETVRRHLVRAQNAWGTDFRPPGAGGSEGSDGDLSSHGSDAGGDDEVAANFSASGGGEGGPGTEEAEKIVHCPRCGDEVLEGHLHMHTVFHCNEAKTRCGVCDECGARMAFDEIDKHIEQFHSSYCSACCQLVVTRLLPHHYSAAGDCPALECGLHCGRRLDSTECRVLHQTFQCPKRRVPCPDCFAIMPKEELGAHRAQCERRKAACPFCGISFGADTLLDHAKACGNRRVKCLACQQMVRLRKMCRHLAAGCSHAPSLPSAANGCLSKALTLPSIPTPPMLSSTSDLPSLNTANSGISSPHVTPAIAPALRPSLSTSVLQESHTATASKPSDSPHPSSTTSSSPLHPLVEEEDQNFPNQRRRRPQRLNRKSSTALPQSSRSSTSSIIHGGCRDVTQSSPSGAASASPAAVPTLPSRLPAPPPKVSASAEHLPPSASSSESLTSSRRRRKVSLSSLSTTTGSPSSSGFFTQPREAHSSTTLQSSKDTLLNESSGLRQHTRLAGGIRCRPSAGGQTVLTPPSDNANGALVANYCPWNRCRVRLSTRETHTIFLANFACQSDEEGGCHDNDDVDGGRSLRHRHRSAGAGRRCRPSGGESSSFVDRRRCAVLGGNSEGSNQVSKDGD